MPGRGQHGGGAVQSQGDRSLPRPLSRIVNQKAQEHACSTLPALRPATARARSSTTSSLKRGQAGDRGGHGPQRHGQDHAVQDADGHPAGAPRQHHASDGTRPGRHESHSAWPAALAYVPQGRMIFPGLTVVENITDRAACGGRRQGPERSTRCSRCCTRCARAAAATCPADSSSSWRSPARWRRNPKVLLLDEPTEGIQPSIIKDIAQEPEAKSGSCAS